MNQTQPICSFHSLSHGVKLRDGTWSTRSSELDLVLLMKVGKKALLFFGVVELVRRRMAGGHIGEGLSE